MNAMTYREDVGDRSKSSYANIFQLLGQGGGGYTSLDIREFIASYNSLI
jgi:hypothetical protein